MLRHQQTQLMQMNVPIACVNLLLSTSILLIVWPTASLPWLFAWYIYIVAYSLLLIANWFAMKDKAVSDRPSGKFMRRVELNILLFGIVWGCASFLTEGASVYRQAVVMIIQVSTYAGLCGVVPALPRLTFRFGVPSLIMIVAFNLSISFGLGLILAALGVVLMAALTSGGIGAERQLNAISQTARDARMAREDLVNAINSMSDAFSLRDEEGKLILANERYHELFDDNEADADENIDLEPHEPTLVGDGRWVIKKAHETPHGGEINIYTDITVLKEREYELINARAEAEQADEAKSRFLSTMSHELRTPLNVILGFSKLMSGGSKIELRAEDIREYAEHISESGEHLLHLINDIIDYTKIGIDKYLLECEPTEATDILHGAIEMAESLHGEKGEHRIRCHIDPDLGQLIVDPSAIHRIVMNLLSNALKFSSESSRVILRAGLLDGGRPFIAVRDYGPGIPAEQLEQVFEPFHQLSTASASANQGTGLGLSLSRHIARLHGGDIKLKSVEGDGLTALVILPATTHLKRKGPVTKALPGAGATKALA